VRIRRKWEDELESAANIIVDDVSHCCGHLENFNTHKFKHILVDRLVELIQDFDGKLIDTD